MAGVGRLLWPGNSPDLNMIEPCLPFMKRYTTKKGPPTKRPEANRVWFQSRDQRSELMKQVSETVISQLLHCS
jgi:hypothetical protein